MGIGDRAGSADGKPKPLKHLGTEAAKKAKLYRGFAWMNADQKQTQFAVSCVPITRSRAITRSHDLHHRGLRLLEIRVSGMN
jgi:hypothetical protein